MIRWIVKNDQPFNVVEDEDFRELMTFVRSGIHIPSADTIKNDLNDNYNASKEIFKRELQVNSFIIIILNLIF